MTTIENMPALPDSSDHMLDWDWEQYQPYYDALLATDLTQDNIADWLRAWDDFSRLVYEVMARVTVATTVDTADETAEARYLHVTQDIEPPFRTVSDRLQRMWVDSGVSVDGMTEPLRHIRTSIELFREENLPLIAELSQLDLEYDKISGAQTVMWNGEERTLQQVEPLLQDTDRDTRKAAFMAIGDRWLQDRAALNDLWQKLFRLRQQVARNAGFDNYLEYGWKERGRLDYSPEDARRFHQSILDTVVPAVKRLNETRRQRLGVDTLKPWDLTVGIYGDEQLAPFEDVAELTARADSIFHQMDGQLGDYFTTMIEQQLLDLENRRNKAPGGYCITFSDRLVPFIFMNAVGTHDNVQTLLHEAGHAFHAFLSTDLPYPGLQGDAPMEFCEVASMSMELISMPYWTEKDGGYYNDADAARGQAEHFEHSIRFWAYMAVVDAFQHWAYTSGDDALDPASCDAKWSALWEQYMGSVDYSGLQDWVATGWHRKLHIFKYPLYYIEYGLAQMGAVQVWRNALQDSQQAALDRYREALSQGGTQSLPRLFEMAGARLAFDSETLGECVELLETQLHQVESRL